MDLYGWHWVVRVTCDMAPEGQGPPVGLGGKGGCTESQQG